MRKSFAWYAVLLMIASSTIMCMEKEEPKKTPKKPLLELVKTMDGAGLYDNIKGYLPQQVAMLAENKAVQAVGVIGSLGAVECCMHCYSQNCCCLVNGLALGWIAKYLHVETSKKKKDV